MVGQSGKLLLALISTVTVRFESRRSHGRALLSHASGSYGNSNTNFGGWWVGSGKLFVDFVRAVCLVSESHGTHGHVLLSHESRTRVALIQILAVGLINYSGSLIAQ